MVQPHAGQAMWYWRIDDNKQGPVSLPQLQAMVRSGQIRPHTIVWTDGMAEWVPAGRLPVLFSPTGAPAQAAPDPGLGLLMPVGPQSGLSMAAGYCGLFGLLIPVLGTVGVVLGIYGLRDLRQHPEKRGRGRAITGIVLGSLMTVVWCFWLVSVVVLATKRH